MDGWMPCSVKHKWKLIMERETHAMEHGTDEEKKKNPRELPMEMMRMEKSDYEYACLMIRQWNLSPPY